MASANWRDYSHAGWVPTTSGHLSFSNIGQSRPSTFSFNPLASPNCQDDATLCALQWRTNRDPVWILRLLGALRQNLFKRHSEPDSEFGDFLDKWFPTNLRNAFLMIGEVGSAPIPYLQEGPIKPDDKLMMRKDSRTFIRGRVFVFQNQRGPGARLRSSLRMREMCSAIAQQGITPELRNAVSSPSSRSDLESRIKVLMTRGFVTGAFTAASVDFLLYRTGELRMMGNSTCPDEPLLAQAYLFLKDVAHHHHHHRGEDDQHLSSYKVESEADGERIIDDKTWRKRTLWSLAKTSGQFRRVDELSRRRQAAGFIAYADAFQRLLGRSRREGGSYLYCPEIATYDFTPQRQSIATKNEDDSWRRQGLSISLTAAIASTISLVLLYTSLSGVANSRFLCQGLMRSGFCDQTHIHPAMAIVVWFFAMAIIGLLFNDNYASKYRLRSKGKKYILRPFRLIALKKSSLWFFTLLVVPPSLWVLFFK